MPKAESSVEVLSTKPGKPPAGSQAPWPAATGVLFPWVHGTGHSWTRSLHWCEFVLYSECDCVHVCARAPSTRVFCRTETTTHLVYPSHSGSKFCIVVCLVWVFFVNDYCASVLEVILPLNSPMGNINYKAFMQTTNQNKVSAAIPKVCF